MTKQAKIALGIFAAVIVVALVIGIFTRFRLGPREELGKPVFAPQGQVVEGFPTELVLDNEARLNNSYSIKYDEKTKQYSVSFSSNQSAASLLASYKQYFTKEGWLIINETNLQQVKGIYAREVGVDVNVTINVESERSSVMISYVRR
ncbi:hypothetical protein C4553_00600 [Candidatus Parcubacteria bacterium]|nr:MAG: hypothetical protein C4553_00600 [Candidatus Parcubacteria bacterium]